MHRAPLLLAALVLLPAPAGGAPGEEPAGIPTEVRRLLDDRDPKMRADGLKQLRGRMDDPAVEAVLPFLDDPDPYCRDYAAVVLLPRTKEPAALKRLVEKGPRASSGAGRLAAADALAALAGGAGGPGLVRLLGDRDARVRATALDALAKGPPLEDPLAAARARAALADPDPSVRAAALDLRAAWRDGDAEDLVAKALADPSPLARSAAAGLAARRFPALLARTFDALAADADWGVRAEAARGAPVLGREPPVETLAALLEDPRLRVRDLAHDALRTISGIDLPPIRADWLAWWARARTSWAGGRGAVRGAERESVAAWHGLPFRSDAVLFVVDLSGSMEKPAGAVDARPRIEVARQELARTIHALPDSARADVLAFMTETARALGKIQPLAAATRSRLTKWFEKRPRGDRGDMGAALVAAILDGEADTVLFLGDGAPSAGECLFRERIRERARQALRLRPVVLHAVAFGSSPPDRAFLEDLAALSGGTCVER